MSRVVVECVDANDTAAIAVKSKVLPRSRDPPTWASVWGQLRGHPVVETVFSTF